MNSGSKQVILPDKENIKWIVNDMKSWPPITWADIYNYLVESKTFDHQKMKAYRSLDAYNYVINGWLGDVSSCVFENVHFLKAAVSPSQLGKANEPYSAWIAAANDGVVLGGSCSCPAGLGRSCSHMASILFAVFLVWQKGQTGESCTDISMMWGKGKKRNVSPSRVENISFKKPTCVFPEGNQGCEVKVGAESVHQFYNHKDLKDHFQKSIFCEVLTVPGTILNKTVNCNLEEAVLRNKTNLEERGSHDYDFSVPVSQDSILCTPCRKFYSKFLALSSEKQSFLAMQTVEQNSDFWKDARKVRITASRANSVPKTSKGDDMKFVKANLYSSFKGNKDTIHGLKHEEQARSRFFDITSVKVKKQGLVLCKEDPWLAASPDGICVNNCLLEIKCPVKDINKLIDNVQYDVRKQDGVLYLHEKASNGYYMQVQIGLHCLGFKDCFFFLWSETTQKILDIKKNDRFLSETIPRLRRFYFQNMLPVLVEHYALKKHKFCRMTTEFCN